MELKLGLIGRLAERCSLLIVPYGIETSFNKKAYWFKEALLIVPYGIETNMQQQ